MSERSYSLVHSRRREIYRLLTFDQFITGGPRKPFSCRLLDEIPILRQKRVGPGKPGRQFNLYGSGEMNAELRLSCITHHSLVVVLPSRRFWAKKPLSTAAHRSAKTPRTTCARWLRRGSDVI